MNKKEFYTNSASGVILLIFSALLTLLAIPIFLKKLGSESYGVFAIVSLIGNLNIFANLGLNTSLVKYLAEQGKCRDSDYDIIITLSMIILIIFPITFFLLYFKNYILLTILKVPQPLFYQSNILYICLLISNVILLIGQTFNAVLAALQKLYLNNIMQMVYNGFYWLSIIFLLFEGLGLGQIGYAILFSATIWFLLVIYFYNKHWGKLHTKGISKNYKRIAKKQLYYSLKIYFSGILVFLFEPLTKILISNLIGIKEVGYFDIAIKVKGQFVGLISRLFDPFFPFIAQLTDFTKIKLIVNDLEQKYLLLAMPIISIIVFCLSPLINLWLGGNKNIEITIATIIITSAYYLFSISIIPVYSYLLSKNHVSKIIIIQLSNVFFNTLIIVTFYHLMQFYAIVIGITVGLISSFILILYYQYKYLNCIIFTSLKHLAKYLISFFLMLFTNAILYCLFDNSYIFMLLITINTLVLSAFLYRLLNLIKKNDILVYFGTNNIVSKSLYRFFIK